MMAPFLHEFTYQAMANDLLPIDSGTKYMYKFQTAAGVYEDKSATLSDSDNVWTELRHMHMREAIDKLMTDFNTFMQENAGFKGYVLCLAFTYSLSIECYGHRNVERVQ